MGLQAGTDDWDRHWKAYDAAHSITPAQDFRNQLLFDSLGLATAGAPVRLLDLGSGPGVFATAALRVRPDAEILGLDLSDHVVAMARERVPRASFFQQDFTQPMKLDATYRGWATHVVCSEVLEHLDDPTAMLRNVRPFLASGAKVVITVPGGPMSAFDRHIGHRRHFTKRLLADTLRDAGLEPAEVHGAGFPFFNLYRLAVIARGEKLVDEGAGGMEGLPLSARLAIRAFSVLFKMNANRTGLGWQLVAVGVEP